MPLPTLDPLPLAGVIKITPPRFGDDRGFFSESWNRDSWAKAGLHLPDFVQDNHSLSRQAGTLRGLHFQAPPHDQGKLVRCGRGRLFDVVVDIRQGSPTYGHWHGEELSAETGEQLWIPPGFLHGFLTMTPETEVIYKVTDRYCASCEGAVHWDSLGISWPDMGTAPLLSDKDRLADPFDHFTSPFVWTAA